MKTIVSLIFIIIISATVHAQLNDNTVTTTEKTTKVSTTKNELTIDANKDVTRLYRRANSRVKKALAFTTKRNKAKQA